MSFGRASVGHHDNGREAKTIPRIDVDTWRLVPPEHIRSAAATSALASLLAQKTAFITIEGRALLTSAMAGNTGAMVGIADLIGPQGGDLSFSWLALAALKGDLAARVQIAAELYCRCQRAKGAGDRASLRRLGSLSQRWFDPVSHEFASAFSMRHDLYKRVSETGLTFWRSTQGDLCDAQQEARTGGATLVVAPNGIPILKDDRDERALIATWKVLTQPLPLVAEKPLHVLATVLENEFPWLSNAIEVLFDDLRLRQSMGVPWFKFRPTLLVGPPGTGKTSFARRVAQLAGVGFGEMSAAGSSDNRLLAGTARGWGSAIPSYVLQVIRRTRVANPVILVDEIDKTRGGGKNGDIRQTLLGMLEPATNKSWLDEGLAAMVDISGVNWMLTANDIDPLRGPLLTRMRVVEVSLPTAEHFNSILLGVRRELAQELGVSEWDLPELPERLEREIWRGCHRGISLRRIRAAYERALSRAVMLNSRTTH